MTIANLRTLSETEPRDAAIHLDLPGRRRWNGRALRRSNLGGSRDRRELSLRNPTRQSLGVLLDLPPDAAGGFEYPGEPRAARRAGHWISGWPDHVFCVQLRHGAPARRKEL